MVKNSQVDILGVRVNNFTKKQILEKVEHFLQNKKFDCITTLNPEIILKAQENKKYRDILNASDLNIADGIGIKFAFWRYGKNLKARYSGIDLMWDILNIANEKEYKIFLLADKNGLSSWTQVRDKILLKFPKLEIDGFDIDLIMSYGNSKYLHKIQDRINRNDIVFVNFGAPEQELFLHNIKTKTSAKLGIGVGGAFDYISGQVPRAPKWMRKVGLEWLFRLIKQPKRIKRIYRAVIVFPFKILFN